MDLIANNLSIDAQFCQDSESGRSKSERPIDPQRRVAVPARRRVRRRAVAPVPAALPPGAPPRAHFPVVEPPVPPPQVRHDPPRLGDRRDSVVAEAGAEVGLLLEVAVEELEEVGTDDVERAALGPERAGQRGEERGVVEVRRGVPQLPVEEAAGRQFCRPAAVHEQRRVLEYGLRDHDAVRSRLVQTPRDVPAELDATVRHHGKVRVSAVLPRDGGAPPHGVPVRRPDGVLVLEASPTMDRDEVDARVDESSDALVDRLGQGGDVAEPSRRVIVRRRRQSDLGRDADLSGEVPAERRQDRVRRVGILVVQERAVPAGAGDALGTPQVQVYGAHGKPVPGRPVPEGRGRAAEVEDHAGRLKGHGGVAPSDLDHGRLHQLGPAVGAAEAGEDPPPGSLEVVPAQSPEGAGLALRHDETRRPARPSLQDALDRACRVDVQMVRPEGLPVPDDEVGGVDHLRVRQSDASEVFAEQPVRQVRLSHHGGEDGAGPF
ncbi:hypothetical protein THAOC_02814 [Thalassiosira oceanica]|uniref:Uncharacterized protein n=1 Tax=Thalassiosira oceanica TaxID=159749 RepID=K0T9M6_THAOC|nr:hypothetical protein THAOC_02814 [Thalassiosira oceanica]|eukprot:EJK75463.1 hypothetical protein THAOC_02814 [Thalassiosira oceanica]